MQVALEKQWLVGHKETIRNLRTVWMECEDGAKPEWKSVEEDAGRLMVWLNQQTHLPDIDIVREHYPTGVNKEEVQVTLEVIIGNHPKAMAQHPHWDLPNIKSRRI